jgi:hypothetical protein
MERNIFIFRIRESALNVFSIKPAAALEVFSVSRDKNPKEIFKFSRFPVVKSPSPLKSTVPEKVTPSSQKFL